MNKLAAHPHDRLQERAPNLPANTVEAVQDIARGLQGKFRGDGYFPLHNDGILQGYAAIRTVGKHHVPVVTTILAPHMHASGINLQKVLESQQQKIADKTLREAFEEKIKEKDGKDIWTGSVNSDGYPNMRDGEKYELASHVALKLNGRTPPDDGGKTVVMHLDNNPRNLTPSNLRVGSQKRNLQQSEDEGRWVPRGPNKEASIGKLALTRMVKEWRAADAAGDTQTADEIARASNQLGLKGREVKQLSPGGAEAAVSLNMGSANHVAGEDIRTQNVRGQEVRDSRYRDSAGPGFQERFRRFKMNGNQPVPSTPSGPSATPGPNESGLYVRKDYKPDSFVSRGVDTTRLLREKQQMTDRLRATPEGRDMVPAMYGHTTRDSGNTLTHNSYHEYVPGLQHIQEDEAGKVQRLSNITKPVEDKHGIQVGDAPYIHPQTGAVAGNRSNLMDSPSGPKLVDFVPAGGKASTPMYSSATMSREGGGMDRIIPRYPQGEYGYNSNFYEQADTNRLRQRIFRPNAKNPVPEPVRDPALMPTAVAEAPPAPPPVAPSAPAQNFAPLKSNRTDQATGVAPIELGRGKSEPAMPPVSRAPVPAPQRAPTPAPAPASVPAPAPFKPAPHPSGARASFFPSFRPVVRPSLVL